MNNTRPRATKKLPINHRARKHKSSNVATDTAAATQAIRCLIDGLLTDGGHHKQWYLEAALVALGEDVDALSRKYGFERGIAP
jgi:hypothetical protein